VRITPVLLVSALLILRPSAAPAAGIALGIEAGPALSNWHLSSPLLGDRDYDARTGLTAGGFLALGPWKGLSLRPGLLFTMKRCADHWDATSDEGEVMGHVSLTYDLDYLEVPLLLDVGLPVTPRLSAHANAGPVFARRLATRQESWNDSGFTLPEEDLGWIRLSDVGLALGAGIELGLGQQAIFLSARYTRGLRNLVAAEDANADIRFRSLAVLIGWSRQVPWP
jgi:hypothetical protein